MGKKFDSKSVCIVKTSGIPRARSGKDVFHRQHAGMAEYLSGSLHSCLGRCKSDSRLQTINETTKAILEELDVSRLLSIVQDQSRGFIMKMQGF
jgi:hypothetical protein